MPPLQLTDDVAKAICDRVAKGIALGHAAEAEGYSARVAWKWLAEGKRDAESGVDSVQARYMQKVARARSTVAERLIGKAYEGIDDPKAVDGRTALSALKTLCSTYYGDKALEHGLAVEAATDAPAASEAPADPGAVTVELVRCVVCGDDQLPGKRYCGNCGKPMAAKAGEAGGLRSRCRRRLRRDVLFTQGMPPVVNSANGMPHDM